MQISKGFRPLCFFACCGFATLGLQHRWLCFGARAGVEFGLQRVCGAAKLSVPCGPGLPDRAGSGAAQFSEDRDVVGRGGDRSWYAGNAREEPSVTQLHLLLLISPFHIPRSFGCCLLFSSPGPSSRLCEHRRRPSLCLETFHSLQLGAWHAPSAAAVERNSQLRRGPAFHPISRRATGSSGCLGRGGGSQTRRALQFGLLCLLHGSQRNVPPLVFQGFPPAPKSGESLVEAMGSSRVVPIALSEVLLGPH